MAKLYNPRLAKVHYSYTVAEIAELYTVHKNTVLTWIKDGLPLCNGKKPYLIHGSDLRDYLQAKREKNKRPCKPGEIYCLPCKQPRKPLDNWAEYMPLDASTGRLFAICSVCGGTLNRYTSIAKLPPIQAKLNITLPKALERLNRLDEPLLSSDFKQ